MFFAGKITLHNADKTQSDSIIDFIDFIKRIKPRDIEKLKRDTIKSLNALYESTEMVSNAF